MDSNPILDKQKGGTKRFYNSTKEQRQGGKLAVESSRPLGIHSRPRPFSFILASSHFTASPTESVTGLDHL